MNLGIILAYIILLKLLFSAGAFSHPIRQTDDGRMFFLDDESRFSEFILGGHGEEGFQFIIDETFRIEEIVNLAVYKNKVIILSQRRSDKSGKKLYIKHSLDQTAQTLDATLQALLPGGLFIRDMSVIGDHLFMLVSNGKLLRKPLNPASPIQDLNKVYPDIKKMIASGPYLIFSANNGDIFSTDSRLIADGQPVLSTKIGSGWRNVHILPYSAEQFIIKSDQGPVNFKNTARVENPIRVGAFYQGMLLADNVRLFENQGFYTLKLAHAPQELAPKPVVLRGFQNMILIPETLEELERGKNHLGDGTTAVIRQLQAKNLGTLSLQKRSALEPDDQIRQKNLLLAFGGHGTYDYLFAHDFRGSKPYIGEHIVQPLVDSGVRFKSILVEACTTGFTMSYFAPLLADNGILIGTITSSGGQATSMLAEMPAENLAGEHLFEAIMTKSHTDITLESFFLGALEEAKESEIQEFFKVFEIYLKDRDASDSVYHALMQKADRYFALKKLLWPIERFNGKHERDQFVTGREVIALLAQLRLAVEDFLKTFPVDVRREVPAEAKDDLLEVISGEMRKIDSNAGYTNAQKNRILENCHVLNRDYLVDYDFFLDEDNWDVFAFLQKNPFCGLIVYSKRDNVFFYEKWVSEDSMGFFLAKYSEDEKDYIDRDLDKLSNLLKENGYGAAQFVAVTSLPKVIDELIRTQE